MNQISKKMLEHLRAKYPVGSRVRLVQMNDPYSRKPEPGSLGTVIGVDDIGTIHVSWDCGSGLGVVYGEDVCEPISGV